MSKLIGSLFLALLTCTSFMHSATAQETDTVASIWTCSFLPGKDMDDLETWRDFFASQLEQLGSETEGFSSFMWTPRFAGAAVDLVWFEYSENLNASSRFSEAYESSGIGPSVDGMWESILDCEGSQSFRRQVWAGDNFSVTPPVVVETFRCVFLPGMGFSQVEEALNAWSGVQNELPRSDEFIAFMFTPFHAASEFDVSFYGVYDSITDYGSIATNYLASSSGQRMDARWREIQRCESRLWDARQML